LSALALAASIGIFLASSNALIYAQDVPSSPGGNQTVQSEASMLVTEIARLERALTRDAGLSQDQRDQAARQLIGLPATAVVPTLKSILTDPNALNNPARLAVARAIADVSDPSGEFVVPLFALFSGDVPRDLIEAAAVALERYKASPEVLRQLISQTDPQKPEAVRFAATRSLGAFPEKSAAQRLVELTGDRSGSIAVTALGGLQDLTGIEASDASYWRDWYSQRKDVADTIFRDELARSRLARLETSGREADATRLELQRILRDRYVQSPADQRSSVLREYVLSGVAATRLVGVQLIDIEAANVGTVPPEIRTLLPDLLADPSIDVRMRSARALQTLNDATALDALLKRLVLESSSEVRVILCDAIARIQDVRAAPALERLLDDPSPAVALAAVRAIGELGPSLSSQSYLEQSSDNVERMDRITRKLTERFASLSPELRPDAGQVVLDSLAALRRKELMPFWIEILASQGAGRRGTDRVGNAADPASFRRAAVMGIGSIGDANAVEVVANSLTDASAEVRIEAARNVALLSRDFGLGDALYRRTIKSQESDPRVREEAWNSLRAMFPLAPRTQLANWAVRDDLAPERKIDVYRALVELADKAQDFDDAALRREQVGELLYADGQYAQAVAEYQRADRDLRSLPNPAARLPRLLRLSERMLRSLVRADRVAEAITIARGLYDDPEYRVTVGSVFRQEAEYLADKPERLEQAERFIEQVLGMNPPLQDQRQFLQSMLVEIRQRKGERNQSEPWPWDWVLASAD